MTTNHHLLLLLLLTLLPLPTITQNQNDTVSCPLNFDLIRRLVGNNRPNLDDPNACRYAKQGLQLVLSDYLRRTNTFIPPLTTAESCWRSYQTLADHFYPNFDLRRNCGFQTNWISTPGCMNITNRHQFERIVNGSLFNPVLNACKHSLSGSSCSLCTIALSNLQASYLNGDSVGNLTNCRAYPFVYAAAFVNDLGPTDRDTSVCLFSIDVDDSKKSNNNNTFKPIVIVIIIVIITSVLAISISSVIWYYYYYRRRKIEKLKRSVPVDGIEAGLNSISETTTLVKYTIDDIKEATRNFSRENIIGRGGYGNVYKGVLPDDDTEVAFKRFKNCTAAGDASFSHEVEVIASVRHVNLVGLRGYCIATTPFEGYQRIIVTDLVRNGSVYDHLFGSELDRRRLSWPIRRKIALGMARGLGYLHHGAQPAIIHRDIKASNILLDENFEAKVADFGLAKFAPEGATHLSTRVAGTMGYVAPEYALYGQLTERSDVYSFGVVLLELLSGRKALLEVDDGQPVLLADWAWSMVRNGTPLEVIDDGMAECGPPETMEKYLMVAVLCSHPQLYARPTMDQVLKMLDTDLPVPSIPERPIPLTSGIEDIERSVSSSGSGQLSTPRGYQMYTIELDGRSVANDSVAEEEEEEEDEKARLSGGR